MTTTDILFIIVWTLIIIISIIMILIRGLGIRQLNHIPRFNYPFEEVCFEIKNIKYIAHNVVEYTAVVYFFKKPGKQLVYDEYHFYDAKYKYNIGEKLYLTKR